jgi:hypothetical protein
VETHVKVLGILHVALSSLGVLAAVIVLFVMGGVVGLVGASDRSADTGFGAVAVGGLGLIIAIVVLIFSLPGLIGGIGLLKLAPWSRVLMIVVSVLDLINIPVGLAIGIYGLWVLTKPETAALLSGRGYQPAAY